MNKYIRFSPGVYLNEDAALRGLRGSGINATTGYVSGTAGYWMSAPTYGPGEKDWWRSQCGHTVDIDIEFCPACGDTRPCAS